MHFPQYRVWIMTQVKSMRQDHGIDAICAYSQPFRQNPGFDARPLVLTNQDRKLRSGCFKQHAWRPPTTDLHDLIAEYALKHLASQFPLLLHQPFADGGIQPFHMRASFHAVSA
jgi:hypothetical protein